MKESGNGRNDYTSYKPWKEQYDAPFVGITCMVLYYFLAGRGITLGALKKSDKLHHLCGPAICFVLNAFVGIYK